MPAVIDEELCNGCKICVRRCPLDALDLVRLDEERIVLGKRVRKAAVVRYPNECWHCGVCRLDCPTGAITFEFPREMAEGTMREMPVPG